MTGWLTAASLENTAIKNCFLYIIMLLIMAYALFRTVGNLIEMCRLRRLRQRLAGYYAARVWGASSGLVQILLVAECLVVNAFCVLLLLGLCDITLW